MHFKLISLLAVVPLLVSSTVLPLTKRLSGQLVDDFARLGTSANNAIVATEGLPDSGATLAQVNGVIATQFDLAFQFELIANDVTTAVTTSGQLSHDDAEALFLSFNPTVGPIIQALGTLVGKRPVFDDFTGTSNSILLDVNSFNNNFAQFKTAVFASFPATFTDIVDAFTATETSIQTWVDNAIAAYSN